MSGPPVDGIFASWQPRYAAYGIPTFPVHIDGAGKRPGIRGWQLVGASGSQQLALKFPDATALGFVLGSRSRIAILDIDTSCKRERDAAFERHGEPAIVVRSPSGGWHGWYRHNGERRLVRPWGEARPVDVLGNGYAVGPPSLAPRGRYAFVRGGLEDVPHLTPLQGLDLPPPRDHTRRASVPLSGPVREGERNKALLRYSLVQARNCDDEATLLDVARTFAEENLDLVGTTHRYTDAEIEAAVAWAWLCEENGTNMVGRGGAVIMYDEIDNLPADATILLLRLRRNHWSIKTFALANAMAASLGWGLPRFQAARDGLVEAGIIECVHPGGRGPGDPPIYQWVRRR
jgi:Bifunctional DNA primase/polymerase, N-terminal